MVLVFLQLGTETVERGKIGSRRLSLSVVFRKCTFHIAQAGERGTPAADLY